MYRVEMTFGHKDRRGLPVRSERISQAEAEVLRLFARWFRGAQCQHHAGSSLGRDSNVIQEPATTIWAYTGTRPSVALLRRLARQIGALLHQESVLLVITKLAGNMYWMYPEAPGE